LAATRIGVELVSEKLTCLCHRLNVIEIVALFTAGKHLLVILRRIRRREVGRLASQESKAEFSEYERSPLHYLVLLYLDTGLDTLGEKLPQILSDHLFVLRL
jgi:hypothetical protein